MSRNAGARPASYIRANFRFSHRVAPFFLLATVDAIVNISVWLVVYFYPQIWPSRTFPAMYWHAHEMLFGFIAAAISGFLLSAMPGWTGRSAPATISLIPLIMLWLAGRIAMLPFITIPRWVASFTDFIFLPALICTLAPPLVRARKYRNLSLIGPLAVLSLANLLFHLGLNGIVEPGEHIAMEISIDIIMILIVVVGGRIIPAFTMRDLKRHGIVIPERKKGGIEFVSLASIVAVLAIDIAMPLPFISGVAALVASFSQGLRLVQWFMYGAARNHPISALHIAYAWLTIGLLLKGIWLLTASSFADKWIHALTIGAFTTMILAVMARFSFAYAEHPPIIARNMAASYGLVSIAAIIRVFGPSLLPTAYGAIIALSGFCWIAAFGIVLQTQIFVGSTRKRREAGHSA